MEGPKIEIISFIMWPLNADQVDIFGAKMFFLYTDKIFLCPR